MYKIPCNQCEKVYIGETGRQLGTRITEHKKEAEKISDKNFTRSTRRASTNEHHKSAIKDHVCQNNHIMNWEAREIGEQESNKFKRWIKESICIRSNTPTMNRDEGAYQLSPIWTQVISTPKPGGEGASTEWLCAFIAIINTFRSLFKASDTFNVFQVLIKMADSHRNCQHH